MKYSMTSPTPVMNPQTPSLVKIFSRFLRLGLTAFGGPAMVAYIRSITVEREKWLDNTTFNNGVALCQALPGATAMQVAAYVGLKIRGLAGAIAAFVGFGLPAFLLMIVLSAFYIQAVAMPPVVSIFRGLQVIIIAIIATAAVTFARMSLKKWVHVAIASIAASTVLFRCAPDPRDPECSSAGAGNPSR